MKTIETIQEAGADGNLRLEIPVGKAGGRFRVVVAIDEAPPSDQTNANGWPAGYFEATAGRWEGDFPLDSEGEFEERDAL